MRWLLSFVNLFTSLSTLFCCALPALFVLLGAGAAFAGLTREIPQLIWIAENKNAFFLVGGVSLTLSVLLPRLVPPPEVCEIDENGGDCQTTKDWTKPLWWFAFIAYGIGALFAYILPFILS